MSDAALVAPVAPVMHSSVGVERSRRAADP
jgi:hypothetical protein